MRAATMGLDRATRKDVRPSPAELARMEAMLEEALDEGSAMLVSGQLAFSAGKAAPALGKQRFGQFLRAGRPSRKLTAA